MFTEDLVKKQLADLEKEYVDYLIEHFAEWEVWAKASQRVADGEEVKEEELPEAFRTELKITRVIVEMMDLGKFDWNNPKVQGIFKELKRRRYYEKPSEERKRKREEAARRRIKKMRRFSSQNRFPTQVQNRRYEPPRAENQDKVSDENK